MRTSMAALSADAASRRSQRRGNQRRIEFEQLLAKAHQFIGAGDNAQLHFLPVGWVNILGPEHAVQFCYGPFDQPKLLSDPALLDKQ